MPPTPTSGPGRPGPVSAVVATLGWLLLAATCHPALTAKDGTPVFKFDAWVYHHAVAQWHAGGSLYDWWAFPDTHLYPFTYPPFAAWALTPLTWGTDRGTQVLLTLATPLCAAALAWLLVRAHAPGGRLLGLGAGALAPWGAVLACTVLEPFAKTIEYGQVNAILLLAVAVDLLAVREDGPVPWLARLAPARGTLSGLAAATKLTPAIAVVVLLARREWRAAATMAGAAVAATLLAAAASPAESWRFFTSAMLDPTRAGDAEYAGNQNLRALLVRLVPAPAADLVWVVCVVIAVAGAWWLAARLGRREAVWGQATVLATQVGTVMVMGLLVSPISWSHHWVWVLPALTALADAAWRERQAGSARAATALAVVALAGLAVTTVAPHWWFPEHEGVELAWPLWAKVVGSSYTLWALGAGAVLTAVCRRGQQPGPAGTTIP